jgi:hypothetical protein
MTEQVAWPMFQPIIGSPSQAMLPKRWYDRSLAYLERSQDVVESQRASTARSTFLEAPAACPPSRSDRGAHPSVICYSFGERRSKKASAYNNHPELIKHFDPLVYRCRRLSRANLTLGLRPLALNPAKNRHCRRTQAYDFHH